jgi:hypothetical protein
MVINKMNNNQVILGDLQVTLDPGVVTIWPKKWCPLVYCLFCVQKHPQDYRQASHLKSPQPQDENTSSSGCFLLCCR